MSDAAEGLRHEVRDGGVAWTVLDRPRARNALTFAMYEGLARIAGEVSADDAVRCWVVTGAGGEAFAAGTDIGQFREVRTPEDALAYEARVDRVVGAVEACAKPLVAAVAGACTGGGLALACAADLRIGAANARFGLPMARTLGNTLSMASHARFAATLGPARVADLVMTARLVGAEEARAWGLLSEVLPDASALEARARALAAEVASFAPLTLRATKEALRRLRAGRSDGDDLVTGVYGSADFREGAEAFLARRPARWTGR